MIINEIYNIKKFHVLTKCATWSIQGLELFILIFFNSYTLKKLYLKYTIKCYFNIGRGKKNVVSLK